jgi:hypothetical protein
LYNGVRDSVRQMENVGGGHMISMGGGMGMGKMVGNEGSEMLVDRSFVLWQPRDVAERDQGISAGM